MTETMFGASISAYQAEGGALLDGKTYSIADISTQNKGFLDSDVTSDFYHHYKEDIRLLKEMGAQCFRFSISWPRILPEGEGEVNPKGVAFYHQVIDECVKNGIEPLVTLYHFDLPYALYEKYGGWINRHVVDAYREYVTVCFREYGDKVRYWQSINEPDIINTYGGHGIDLDGKDVFEHDKYQINHHQALAHAWAVKLCHEMCPGARIGPVFGYVPIYPKTCKPEDFLAVEYFNSLHNRFFQELFLNGRYLEDVLIKIRNEGAALSYTEEELAFIRENPSDFVALNYYMSQCVSWYPEDAEKIERVDNKYGKKGSTVLPGIPGYYAEVDNELLEKTSWDWAIDPIGIRIMLKQITESYHLPVMVVENGMGYFDELTEDKKVHDDYRIAYMKDHIEQCMKAVEKDGVELIAYNAWTFIDLLSTSQGFRKRYGLVYVDQNDDAKGDCSRYPKDSYYWYRDFIKNQKTAVR